MKSDVVSIAPLNAQNENNKKRLNPFVDLLGFGNVYT